MLKARLTELNYAEILRYLGTRGRDIPEHEELKVRECMDEIKRSALPNLVYRKVAVNETEQGLELDGLAMPGRDLKKLLKGCGHAILFAATLGYRVDQVITRMQVEDMARAVILDACASCAVENICDNFENDMRDLASQEGMFLTDRFSPGYGDLPISVQKDVAAALNCQRRIGLIVADNYMMTPVKSVTAVMGISPVQVSLRKDRCSFCSKYESCSFRDGQCVLNHSLKNDEYEFGVI